MVWGGSICDNEFLNLLACMSGGSSIFACDEAHKLRCKNQKGAVNVVSRCILPFQKPFVEC